MKWVIRGLAVLAAILLVSFLVFRTPDTDPDDMRAKYGGAPSQFVELANGQTVHLRDEGPRDAMPIILLHGSNADLHTWQPWVESLKDDYRIIRYDQIGHGLTGPNVAGAHTPEEFVGTVDLVADKLGLERFVLGGNSMGGSISMGYALKHSDRLMGLALVDAGGADIQNRASGNTAFTLARTPVINQLMLHITPRSMIESSLRQSVSNQEIVTDATVDRYWELLRYPGNRAATLDRFQKPWWKTTAEAVSAVETPTLVMWGEEDSLISFDAAKWYKQHLPNAQLVSYPGIGHLPMEEHAEKSAQDLRKWLESLTQTAEE